MSKDDVVFPLTPVYRRKGLYETLDGGHHRLPFDVAMLLPPFGGVPLVAYDRDGSDITSELFAPSGFMKVDADYTAKAYEEWKADDWPRTYQTPGFDNARTGP